MTTKNITRTAVTSGRFDDEKATRWSASRFNLFVDSPLNDLTDTFFKTYEVYNFPYVSHCWNAVIRAANREVIAAAVPVLAKHVGLKPEDIALKYSRYAGCSCGCSPGYVGRILNADYAAISKLSRFNVWMEVAATETALANIQAEMNKQAAKLPEEKEREMNRLRLEAMNAGIAARCKDQERRSRSWSTGTETTECPHYSDVSIGSAWAQGYALQDRTFTNEHAAKNTEASLASSAL